MALHRPSKTAVNSVLLLIGIMIVVALLAGLLTSNVFDSFRLGFYGILLLEAAAVIWRIINVNRSERPRRPTVTTAPPGSQALPYQPRVDDTQELPVVSPLQDLSPEEIQRRLLEQTERLARATEAQLAHQQEMDRRAEEAEKNLQRMLSDTNVVWRKHPHWKYFAKRSWKILLAWLVCGALIWVTSLLPDNSSSFQILAWFTPLIAAWYTMRRYYKWSELYLCIAGASVTIQESDRWYFVLLGNKQSITVDKLGSYDVNYSWPERSMRRWFNCGSIELSEKKQEDGNAPGHVLNDKFRLLTDVINPEQFIELVQERRNAFLTAMSTAQRSGTSSSR